MQSVMLHKWTWQSDLVCWIAIEQGYHFSVNWRSYHDRQQHLVDSSPLKGGISQYPTICAWTVEGLEHIATRSSMYDANIDKYA